MLQRTLFHTTTREAEGANLAGINPGLFLYFTLKRATRALSQQQFRFIFFALAPWLRRRLLRASKLFAAWIQFLFKSRRRRRRRADVESPRAILIGADR